MNILICDDQALIRDSLVMLIELEADMQVIGIVDNGRDAVKFAIEKKPDIILMDLKMQGLNGIEATREIMSHDEQMRVLVLTTFGDDTWIFDAIRAGAKGYILKDSSRHKLLAALRDTYAGKSYVDSAVADVLFQAIRNDQPPIASYIHSLLSERELDVLNALAKGYTNRDIAAHLNLSEGTVRNYISNIITKLAVEDRTQAAVIAIQYGLGNPRHE